MVPLGSASGSAPPPPTPGDEPDLRQPAAAVDCFRRAARANLDSPLRRGSVVRLPARGRLLVTGDLHDHGLNFLRILRLADLPASPDHHLVLHELIHGPNLLNGMDLSVRSLLRAAALKVQRPRQVHLLLANHDLAQLSGKGILKAGHNSIDPFALGIDYLYADAAEQVTAAMNDFFRSLPLAVRCDNGVFVSHSLPSPHQLPRFDLSLLDRLPTEADLAPDGSAHMMVWGRRHTQPLADTLSQRWGVKQFVMGHQPAEMGYELQGQNMLILASNHEHGTALPIALDRGYDRPALLEALFPLNAIVIH